MHYRHLGRTGIKVSEVSLGSWLTYGATVEQERAAACIHRAYELGINFFDTANAYAGGEAEKVVGKALADLRRDSYVLATKLYWPMDSGPNDRGLSRKHIMEQCHASLKRLGTDYVDLYYCHRYDTETPLEETLRAMDDLVHHGKVLYVGVSEWSAIQIAEAVRIAKELNLYRIEVDQPYYSMLGRGIEREVMPLCEREGIGIVPYSPLAQGVLTGKYKPGQPVPADSRAADESVGRFIQGNISEQNLLTVAKLSSLAAQLGLSVAQLALAWCLRKPIVSSVLVGATKPQQVEENVKASGVRLSETDLQQIEEILGS